MTDASTIQAAEPPPHPPEYFTQPICSIDWAGSSLTCELFAAWATAQSAVRTVGKDEKNTEKNYRYASADSLVAEARRAFSGAGLALIHSWRLYDPQFGKIGDNQWSDYRIVMDWAVLCGAGAVPGVLRGTAEILVVGSRGKPPDKSVLGARTTLAGAVAMALAGVDRAIDDEDVNLRPEDPETGKAPQRAAGRVGSEAKDLAAAALRRLVAARRAAGHAAGGKPVTPARALEDLMGVGFQVDSDEAAAAVVQAADAQFDDLRAQAEMDGGAR